MRTEVFYRENSIDGRVRHLFTRLNAHNFPVEELAIVDVYISSAVGDLNPVMAAELFSDKVSQKTAVSGQEVEQDRFAAEGDLLPVWDLAVEISTKPGVTDPLALTCREAVSLSTGKPLPPGGVIQTSRQFLLKLSSKTELPEDLFLSFYNPLIQKAVLITRKEWEQGKRFPQSYPYQVTKSSREVIRYDLAEYNDKQLAALSRERLLSLSLEEMHSIKEYFNLKDVRAYRELRGISCSVTDVELEMIAQTWSEHCKHKIFQADIEYREGNTTETINSLFNTYIKKTTETLKTSKKFLRSVFHDNSGVIEFDEENLLCFKVETHNSPSTLDPYGGAITGIVGVNRDIIGTGKGAKPLFNTDVLCFGEPETKGPELPEGLLSPEKVLDGVHRGIIDGGNQSGIPVVSGAFLFDDSFTGKPLVFCGTGGILPAEIGGEGSWIKHVRPGHKAVMVGGRIGKDGIHGATFSSRVLDEDSPTSAVQIGDPITQKKMLDFILEARDLGLYAGITDNGAGGLSSSLGEMAELSGGIKIELDLCPLKYEGLSPWEIIVSESQERMSLSVSGETLDEFLSLARRRGVEAAVIGEFNDSGFIEAYYRGSLVCLLAIPFFHHGLPNMHLKARWIGPAKQTNKVPNRDPASTLLEILAEPNVASKEPFVRQYDHEVKGQSIIKPFMGAEMDGPTDGGVIKPRYDSFRGVTVTHGICPRYGDTDTYHMAMCAVDEAYRSHIGLGGDPQHASALDNFCWPDPVKSETTPDGEYKLAQLVRACKGLRDACIAYELPLISGKDSMKNDTYVGGEKISVRPTLLISLMGIIPDIRLAQTTDFKIPGDRIYLLGETRGELGGTIFEKITSSSLGRCPEVLPEKAKKIYNALSSSILKGQISSCHDISDGGVGAALAESALGGRLGALIDLRKVMKDSGLTSLNEFLFCETPSRFLVTVSEKNEKEFSVLFEGLPVWKIGLVQKKGEITFTADGEKTFSLTLDNIENAWKRF